MSLHAVELTLPRGQRRVDGVESPRHRADAATEARRVDGVGRPKFDSTQARRLRDLVEGADASGKAVLCVGPDRGWEEPGELLALRRHGFDLVTLGPRTLRTDVALVGLVALVQDWLDS